MPQPDLVIRGRRVALQNSLGPASVHLSAGRISAIADFEDTPSNCEIVEAGAASVVMPGLVDTHVHVNEPGRTEWEGFASATRSAAAGGITTIVDMPLNCIPATTTLAGLNAKLAATRGKLTVDTAFWGGVVPGNTNQLAQLWDAGVVGFNASWFIPELTSFPTFLSATCEQRCQNSRSWARC